MWSALTHVNNICPNKFICVNFRYFLNLQRLWKLLCGWFLRNWGAASSGEAWSRHSKVVQASDHQTPGTFFFESFYSHTTGGIFLRDPRIFWRCYISMRVMEERIIGFTAWNSYLCSRKWLYGWSKCTPWIEPLWRVFFPTAERQNFWIWAKVWHLKVLTISLCFAILETPGNPLFLGAFLSPRNLKGRAGNLSDNSWVLD